MSDGAQVIDVLSKNCERSIESLGKYEASFIQDIDDTFQQIFILLENNYKSLRE